MLAAAFWAGTLAGEGTAPGSAATNAPAPEYGDPLNSALLPGKGPIPTWNGYPKVWAQRRAQFDRQRAQDRHALVFLGDSITQGWNGLAADFPDRKVANRGIGGDTTRGALYRLKDDVLDLQPAGVVLLIGTNDLGLNGSAEDAEANIRAIVDALEKSSAAMPIVVCTVMPRDKKFAPEIQKLNGMIAGMVKGDSRLTLCDTWSLFATEEGACKREEFPDRLHPNSLGYEKWVAALKPILDRLKIPAGRP